MIDTATLHVQRAVSDIWRAAEAGTKMDYAARARTRADTGWAIHNVRGAIDKLIDAHGTSSFAEVNPLQRIWRDSNIAARHAVADRLVNLELYGKSLLGVDERITPLV
jgi:alkylation response protein AidB-like acyl-CoA dehydrogenase